MRSRLNQYLGIVIASAFVLANGVFSYASDEIEAVEASKAVVASEVPTAEVVENPSDDAADFEDGGTVEEPSQSEIQVKQQEFLTRLRDELSLTKSDYRQILNSIADIKTRLETVSEAKLTLSDQIQNLDDLIAVSFDKLISVIGQIVETENEIAVIYEQIDIKQTALAYQKELLKDYIRVIYQEEQEYFSINENGDLSTFKLLLSDETVGTNMKKLEYFSLLNETGQQMIEKLSLLTEQLEGHEQKLLDKKSKLGKLQAELEVEKNQLEFQKQSKANLLNITLGQENIYSQLLEQTLQEQEQLLEDVKNLNNALNFIEQKIIEEGDNFNPDDYLALLDYRTQVLYDFRLNYEGTVDGFMWPVDPDRGISAYFRQPSYVGVFGVQHNAIDLPAYQGSMVRAAADGVVYTARDNGYGYNYIILAHADGFMTVYGHLSELLVDEGDTIAQGSVIGLSGGMPGTLGAGYMTTGPHLHFEVMLNGLYVDPLDYMPLEVLTEEQIEALPEKYYDNWADDVYRSEYELIQR